MNFREEYKRWLNSSFINEETKKELRVIAGNEKEIEDRFYKNLSFGTAGLRGIIGAGTNRMNQYTVSKATQGLANFILQKGGQDRGVAISYDSRHMSKEFSEITANCLNANGIKTYVFENLRPVPELSYAVRKLNCIAGIMITASHNPPQYNGYKVYWEDGAQIVAPIDSQIIEEVNKIQRFENAKNMDKQEAIQKGLYHTVGMEMDDAYIGELKKIVLNPEIIKEQKDLKIVYTPLHGTGKVPVERILRELGFENIFIVPEQAEPNGDFPTVDYPNPEDKSAFQRALDLAQKQNADIVLANDPDADRLGVYAKDSKTNEYLPFTGNMSGMLIAEYVLSQKREKGILPENGALITTIVSTDLAKAIAKEYNLKLFEVLTGFKYIGEKIKEFEKEQSYSYEFGFEESYGCLVGTHARDKDGIAAVMLLCEAAAYYRAKGMTLCDQMKEIYEKYGYYLEDTKSITLEGADGAKKMQEILQNLRNLPLTQIANYKVIEFKDYEEGIVCNMVTGEKKNTGLPKSKVIYYALEGNNWCCIRPSGTEPKIKCYIGSKGKTKEEANKIVQDIEAEMLQKMQ